MGHQPRGYACTNLAAALVVRPADRPLGRHLVLFHARQRIAPNAIGGSPHPLIRPDTTPPGPARRDGWRHPARLLSLEWVVSPRHSGCRTLTAWPCILEREAKYPDPCPVSRLRRPFGDPLRDDRRFPFHLPAGWPTWSRSRFPHGRRCAPTVRVAPLEPCPAKGDARLPGWRAVSIVLGILLRPRTRAHLACPHLGRVDDPTRPHGL